MNKSGLTKNLEVEANFNEESVVLRKSCKFVPMVTTPAGGCLTMENWQEIGVSCLACAFDSLLMKPGLALLSKIGHLSAYLGWDKDIILDARMFVFNQEGYCTIQSIYDGARTHISIEQFWSVIERLRPTMVLVPNDLMVPKLPEDISLISPEHQTSFDISDKPAADAYQGLVYQSDTVVSILEAQFRLHMEPLDPHCACPTCQQALTGAYLHHLFQHTPLLCQRLLIMHNVYFRKK